MSQPLVETRNLKMYFPVAAGAFGSKTGMVHAVDDVSISIAEQETFALVGESGCGKTTLGRVILRLLERTSGEVYYRGQEISGLPHDEMRRLRGKMQVIFQDPYASLNPRMRIRDIILEPIRTHEDKSQEELNQRLAELMELVGLAPDMASKYPHQFSGGQRQRIGIARALALNPEFIFCDEAVSALDVSIQAQVLNLLAELQGRFSLTYLFVTHDLSVVRHIADRVCVMFLGKAMEVGTTEEIFSSPKHPYTSFLISAVPVPNPHMRNREKMILEGDIPSPINLPPGCRFHTRCPFCQDICRSQEPEYQDDGGHGFACHFPLS
jgi:oligopeptide transport system ATP-binding protein